MEDLLRVKDIVIIFKDKNLNKVTLKQTKNIIQKIKDIILIFKDKYLNKKTLKNTRNIIQEKIYSGLVGTGSDSVSVYKLQKVKKKIKIMHKYLSK